MENKICPCCGAKTVEYKHGFNEALAIGLYRLYEHNGPINLKHLGLTRNQWDNFQKLRYWGLVTKHTDSNGKRVGGEWEITSEGISFIKGHTSIRTHVWTYRGDSVRTEGDTCWFSDYHDPNYKQREDYASEAIAR